MRRRAGPGSRAPRARGRRDGHRVKQLSVEEVRALEARYATGVIPLKELVFDHGEGAWLVTAGRTRYLDLASGHGVAILGHGNARVAAALGEQAAKLITITQ